ncbi:hypothetical protein OG894_41980 (plasmid) [Streptomyces sp. NBC_01724]|uniref:hypothetical protein n=1 Tax=Streptomyces sp. NBC_01724 TaxID=2975922 RepID=UPI002E31E0C8|nr:hypothetical protein [Streptomyces sp. NBC_01724]
MVKKASKPAIGRMLANLQRGNAHLVLARAEEDLEGSWYVQVGSVHVEEQRFYKSSGDTSAAGAELLFMMMGSTANRPGSAPPSAPPSEPGWPRTKALATGPGDRWRSIDAVMRAVAMHCLPFSSTSTFRRGRCLPQS